MSREPIHVGWRTRVCHCGKDTRGEAHSSGHVRMPRGFGPKTVILQCCSVDCLEAAKDHLEQKGKGAGYLGEWTKELGLLVEVSFDDTSFKQVRII